MEQNVESARKNGPFAFFLSVSILYNTIPASHSLLLTTATTNYLHYSFPSLQSSIILSVCLFVCLLYLEIRPTVCHHSPAVVCDRSGRGSSWVHLQSKGEKVKQHPSVHICFSCPCLLFSLNSGRSHQTRRARISVRYMCDRNHAA